MKKLALLALSLLIFSGCRKEEPKPTGEPVFQDYTSFVFEQTIDNLLPNCVAGYFDADGYCWKIADLGDLLTKGQQTDEIKVDDSYISEVFFFCDIQGGVRTDETFTLRPKRKNVFKIRPDVKGISNDKSNPKEYPQEKNDYMLP